MLMNFGCFIKMISFFITSLVVQIIKVDLLEIGSNRGLECVVAVRKTI